MIEATAPIQSARLGILCILIGMFCISLNDMTIKSLSGGYPLHELVFMRTFIGISLSIVVLHFEGGFALLRTRRPGLHLVRALLVVFSNSAFYAGIVAMPLATANALYFIAPIIVTLLSIPVLGERIGIRRGGAVVVGFMGVLIMLSPQLRGAEGAIGWYAVLPMAAAFGYAGMAVLSRKLGSTSRASAMAIYLQTAFLIVSVLFFAIAGDGKFLWPDAPESLQFLLRPWVWPLQQDVLPIVALGFLSAVIGYTMGQAYRLANASTVAPFEYVLLIYALFWGWTVFGEWPQPEVLVGAAVIIAAGIYIVFREEKVG